MFDDDYTWTLENELYIFGCWIDGLILDLFGIAQTSYNWNYFDYEQYYYGMLGDLEQWQIDMIDDAPQKFFWAESTNKEQFTKGIKIVGVIGLAFAILAFKRYKKNG